MIRKFENSTNTQLLLEQQKELSVIIGAYDNSKEKYYPETSDYTINTNDGNKFYINYHSEKTVLLNKIIASTKSKNEFVINYNKEELKIGSYVYVKKYNCSTDSYSTNIYTIVELKENSIIVDRIIYDEFIGYNLIYTENNLDFPDWIYPGSLLTLVNKKVKIYNIIIDGNIEQKEVSEDEFYNIEVDYIYNSVAEKFFVIKETIKEKIDNFYIEANKYINSNGVVEKNTLNSDINIQIDSINNGEFYKCSSFNISGNKGILLYDKLYDKKSGKITTSGNTVFGENTNFNSELNIEDLIIINNKEYTIKKILSNNKLILDKNLDDDVISAEYYKTSSIFDNVESIIYGEYDDSEFKSQGNFKNIMPVRGNRKIFYKLRAGEIVKSQITTTEFTLDISLLNNDIYKLYINGTLLIQGKDYTINTLNNSIKVLNQTILKRYNNYCYAIYYDKNQENILGEYIKLSYIGYMNNFSFKDDYLKSLYDFKFYFNFSESLSYEHYEFENQILDYIKRKRTDKRHQLTFSSYVSNDNAQIDSNIIVNNLDYIVKNKDFRLIRYNMDTGSFVIYNQCSLVNPSSESIAEDVNVITYTIDFKDKISFSDRSFGDGRWGKFELFGLKLISIQ